MSNGISSLLIGWLLFALEGYIQSPQHYAASRWDSVEDELVCKHSIRPLTDSETPTVPPKASRVHCEYKRIARSETRTRRWGSISTRNRKLIHLPHHVYWIEQCLHDISSCRAGTQLDHAG